jgi:hypothetical protein
LLLGCGPSKETVEAERVLRAIDVLRDSPGAAPVSRIELAGELERLPVTSPLAVAARDACARAYRLLIEGAALSDRVHKALDQPDAAAGAVLDDLAQAEAKIKKSSEAMPDCDRAAAELRRATR